MPARIPDHLLAWYFVLVWGVGFIATKLGLQYAAPFTFLSMRFAFGIALLAPLLVWLKPVWPANRAEWMHMVVAGLLVHAIHLSGSHYSQYLGVSAGATAVILALQPIVTALVATRLFAERLSLLQWVGVALGFGGVALIVWHKIDIRAISPPGLLAVLTGLAALTAGTLYQRRFCANADLRASALIQFVASLLLTAPLAVMVEGFAVRWSLELAGAIVFLVVGASILAVSALHTLMRRGAAAVVSSLLYFPAVVAVTTEWLLFGVVPTAISLGGIAVVCTGVALAAGRLGRGRFAS